MNTTLFFLRSSEQKIAINILPYALGLDNSIDITPLNLYTSAYGHKSTDVGIYALTDNEISGAAWVRLFKESDGVIAYVDNATPVLMIGVMPNVRGEQIGSLIMNQLLQEVAVIYDQISVQANSRSVKFYERLGFDFYIDSEKKKIEDTDTIIMVKKLTKKAITRPTDGYDPRRWMD